MSTTLVDDGANNHIAIGTSTQVHGRIRGNNNTVVVDGSTHPSEIRLNISGDGNVIRVGVMFAAKGLQITCGSHVPAHNTSLEIGENFSIEPGGRFLLYTSGNKLRIGRHCMFSNGVTVRCGESPHLIFDRDTGAFLDISDGVFIGDHVWVGEQAYITKGASIGDECVVGACSVVTRRFTETNVAIAGNPAVVVRKNVQWIRNRGLLVEGSKYKQQHAAFHSQFPKRT